MDKDLDKFCEKYYGLYDFLDAEGVDRHIASIVKDHLRSRRKHVELCNFIDNSEDFMHLPKTIQEILIEKRELNCADDFGEEIDINDEIEDLIENQVNLWKPIYRGRES